MGDVANNAFVAALRTHATKISIVGLTMARSISTDLVITAGTPVPAVTSTCSTSGTWFTDAKRSWRTPLAT